LIHGFSPIVRDVLVAHSRKRLRVFVSAAAPGDDGARMARLLAAADVDATLVPDAAVAYYMPKIDFVLTGAVGVVESGGVINKVGSCQVAILARAHNKPVYVAAPTYRVRAARLFI
jgi:translation initiation factor eIF-2B subunit alpha